MLRGSSLSAEKFREKTQKREYIQKMISPFKESASITETSGLSFHETYLLTCLETGEYFKFWCTKCITLEVEFV